MHLGKPHSPETRIAERSTPAAGEARIRRQIRAVIVQSTAACRAIQQTVAEVGYDDLAAHLGEHAGEVEKSYAALASLVAVLSPATPIPDLVTGTRARTVGGRRRGDQIRAAVERERAEASRMRSSSGASVTDAPVEAPPADPNAG